MNEAIFLQVYLSNQIKKEFKSFTILQKDGYFIVLLKEDLKAWISLSLLEHNNNTSIKDLTIIPEYQMFYALLTEKAKWVILNIE